MQERLGRFEGDPFGLFFSGERGPGVRGLFRDVEQPASSLSGNSAVDRKDLPDRTAENGSTEVYLSGSFGKPGPSPEIHHLSIGKRAKVVEGAGDAASVITPDADRRAGVALLMTIRDSIVLE